MHWCSYCVPLELPRSPGKPSVETTTCTVRVPARWLRVDIFLVDFPFDGMNSGYHIGDCFVLTSVAVLAYLAQVLVNVKVGSRLCVTRKVFE